MSNPRAVNVTWHAGAQTVSVSISDPGVPGLAQRSAEVDSNPNNLSLRRLQESQSPTGTVHGSLDPPAAVHATQVQLHPHTDDDAVEGGEGAGLYEDVDGHTYASAEVAVLPVAPVYGDNNATQHGEDDLYENACGHLYASAEPPPIPVHFEDDYHRLYENAGGHLYATAAPPTLPVSGAGHVYASELGENSTHIENIVRDGEGTLQEIAAANTLYQQNTQLDRRTRSHQGQAETRSNLYEQQPTNVSHRAYSGQYGLTRTQTCAEGTSRTELVEASPSLAGSSLYGQQSGNRTLARDIITRTENHSEEALNALYESTSAIIE
ncbi:hypothetical protein Bbelb_189380 [Branchiostoma belcheri]|nr:hypothetical protein Bbelb_189380 [Branchiostoma belcheri]